MTDCIWFDQSEEIGKLAAAMVEILKKVDHPKKNKRNPHFKNEYADLNSVIDCSRDARLEHGVWLLQLPCGLGLVTQISHVSGQWIRVIAEMEKDKTGPQAFGSSFTYYRRYSGQGVMDVASEADDDGEAATTREEKVKKSAKPKPAEEPKAGETAIAAIKRYVESIEGAKSHAGLGMVGDMIHKDETLSDAARAGLKPIYKAKKDELDKHLAAVSAAELATFEAEQ